MTISRLRLEDISLYNHVKYNILGLHFVERVPGASLSYDSSRNMWLPDYSSIEPSPVSRGRGWVPFDEVGGVVDTTSEQSSRVLVAGATTYDVNYFLGGIKNPNSTPTSVTYSWNYVSVIKGWPGIDPPPLPLVAIDIDSSSTAPLQLGPGYISNRAAKIHIFASSNAERDDITDILFSSLRGNSTTLIDYSLGDYLDPNGYYDNTFSPTEVPGVSSLYFENVTSRNVNSPGDWADLNKYRSVLSFTLRCYIG